MAVVDNNVLSAFSKTNRLYFLKNIFAEVKTPESVMEELTRAENRDYVQRIDKIRKDNGEWLTVISLDNDEKRQANSLKDHALSQVDAKCMTLAKMRKEILLTDDKHVVTMASQNDIEVWDIKLLIMAAIKKNLVRTLEELNIMLNDLKTEDMYYFSDKDIQDLRNALD